MINKKEVGLLEWKEEYEKAIAFYHLIGLDDDAAKKLLSEN